MAEVREKKLMSRTDLRTMALHERKHVGGKVSVQRVIGGWIYWHNADVMEGLTEAGNDHCMAAPVSGVFVPESPLEVLVRPDES